MAQKHNQNLLIVAIVGAVAILALLVFSRSQIPTTGKALMPAESDETLWYQEQDSIVSMPKECLPYFIPVQLQNERFRERLAEYTTTFPTPQGKQDCNEWGGSWAGFECTSDEVADPNKHYDDSEGKCRSTSQGKCNFLGEAFNGWSYVQYYQEGFGWRKKVCSPGYRPCQTDQGWECCG